MAKSDEELTMETVEDSFGTISGIDDDLSHADNNEMEEPMEHGSGRIQSRLLKASIARKSTSWNIGNDDESEDDDDEGGKKNKITSKNPLGKRDKDMNWAERMVSGIFVDNDKGMSDFFRSNDEQNTTGYENRKDNDSNDEDEDDERYNFEDLNHWNRLDSQQQSKGTKSVSSFSKDVSSTSAFSIKKRDTHQSELIRGILAKKELEGHQHSPIRSFEKSISISLMRAADGVKGQLDAVMDNLGDDEEPFQMEDLNAWNRQNRAIEKRKSRRKSQKIPIEGIGQSELLQPYCPPSKKPSSSYWSSLVYPMLLSGGRGRTASDGDVGGGSKSNNSSTDMSIESDRQSNNSLSRKILYLEESRTQSSYKEEDKEENKHDYNKHENNNDNNEEQQEIDEDDLNDMYREESTRWSHRPKGY